MPVFRGLIRHTFSKIDGQLCVDPAPILPPACPFLRNVHHRQIQHLEQAVIRREDGFCLRHLAELAVEALYGVSCVDEPTYLFRGLEVGAQVWPVIPPGLCYFRVFTVPFLCKGIQSVYYSDYDDCKKNHFDPRSEIIGEENAAGIDLTYDFVMDAKTEELISAFLTQLSDTVHPTLLLTNHSNVCLEHRQLLNNERELV